MNTSKICQILKEQSEVKAVVGVLHHEAVCVILEKETDSFLMIYPGDPHQERAGYFNQQSAIEDAMKDFPGVKFSDFCALQSC